MGPHRLSLALAFSVSLLLSHPTAQIVDPARVRSLGKGCFAYTDYQAWAIVRGILDGTGNIDLDTLATGDFLSPEGDPVPEPPVAAIGHDGAYIVYRNCPLVNFNKLDEAACHLWVMNTDGSGKRKLTDIAYDNVNFLGCSRDDPKVVFLGNGVRWGTFWISRTIYMLDLQGHETSYTPAGNLSFAMWTSCTKDYLGYSTRDVGGSYKVCLYDRVTGTAQTVESSGWASTLGPGGRILVTPQTDAVRYRNYVIYKYAGGEKTELRRGSFDGSTPFGFSWSNDKDWICLTRASGSGGLAAFNVTDGELVWLSTTGSNGTMYLGEIPPVAAVARERRGHRGPVNALTESAPRRYDLRGCRADAGGTARGGSRSPRWRVVVVSGNGSGLHPTVVRP